MKKYKDITEFENLRKAFNKAKLGNRQKQSVAKFENNQIEAIMYLQYLLRTGKYETSDYYEFYVYEPKKRLVKTNSFKDKVVQQALCEEVVRPILKNVLIKDNYASQPGKGTHFGLERLKSFLQSYYFSRKAKIEAERKREGKTPSEDDIKSYSTGYVLKCDIRKYFYSIRHKDLKRMVRRYFHEPNTLWIINHIIDSDEDPGIPIGNQLSQWLALLFLNELDHIIKERLKIKFYGRYMDDFYLIHEDKEYLKYCLGEIEGYLKGIGLELNQKTQIFPLRHGIDFLGFHTYLTESGKVIRKLRRGSKNKMRKKIRKYASMLEQKRITLKEVEQSYKSWKAHASHGDCYYLIKKMDQYYNKYIKKEKSNGTKNK